MQRDWIIEYYAPTGTAFGFQLAKPEPLHREESAYQTIEIYESTQFGKVMLLDGMMMLAERDNHLYHEMMTHPAIFTAGHAQDVAIIGGGDCGTLKEVLKHTPVRSLTQVEIDQRVTEVAERFFPELCSANQDPRARLLFEDGVAWIQQVPDASLDLLIVDSSEPIGFGAELFGLTFCQHAYRALRPGGLLVQQSESPLWHMDSVVRPMHQNMLAAKFQHPTTLPFPHPCYPSGTWSATLAGKHSDPSSVDFKRISTSTVETRYYCEAVHRAALLQAKTLK